jgi:hypothetical protein
MRHYLIVGGKFDYDVFGSRSGKINPPVLFINSNYPKSILKSIDLGAEVGVGLSFYLRYATVSPEVKFSYGLRNLNKNDLLLSNIDRITSNFVYFTIHIEN